ncbi:response regulator [Sphingomonas sp.]|jgi:signal transduction histidine kinase/CheY-like chemotaxis protein|uniref:response regulator n=1 Tax=Sphingomonas sp. TaxID=28214 RepID=UPI002EDAFE74
MDNRVLLLALRGRDAQIIAGLLQQQGKESYTCSSADGLALELAKGAGCALMTEESLGGDDLKSLEAWLAVQEPWSDFPFILLATKRAGRRPGSAVRVLEALGNVVILERPIHSETLASAVSSALRVRRRQYEARGQLLALQAAEERLTHLNASLEARIAERTTELSRANNRLMEEVGERERAQAALVQSQKVEAIGQLTGGIAHDFNNLLTVISGNLELIQRRASEQPVLTYAENASKAAARAAKLTSQLLAFSRTQQLTLEPVAINALVTGMQDLLDHTLGPQVKKEQTLSAGEVWVMADANQLELAILNLSINARDAMTEGGLLGIATTVSDDPPPELPAGSYGVVTVTDTGPGIPPKILSRVFDPFFTTKPVGKGTGLGLSQVIGIAKQSRGTATAHSIEGRGASVSIWLPTTAAPAALPNGGADDAGNCKEEGRVLVIDDDEGVRRFIVNSLEMLGYAVKEASSGEEGLELLTHERPDLLIVDFAMDGINGDEVCARAFALLPGLPIILATGYAETGDLACSGSIRSVLRKPFRVEDLLDAIRSALRASSALC